MSLKIRLTRMGAKKRPFYRIVIADSRAPRDGKFIEIVGNLNPLNSPAALNIDEDKILSWLKKGAQPSDTVKSLLVSSGIMAKYLAGKQTKKNLDAGNVSKTI